MCHWPREALCFTADTDVAYENDRDYYWARGGLEVGWYLVKSSQIGKVYSSASAQLKSLFIPPNGNSHQSHCIQQVMIRYSSKSMAQVDREKVRKRCVKCKIDEQKQSAALVPCTQVCFKMVRIGIYSQWMAIPFHTHLLLPFNIYTRLSTSARRPPIIPSYTLPKPLSRHGTI